MDDDFIPISALQHYLYCPRQCALIHVERQWAESRHTAEGRVLHERTDEMHVEKRKGVRSVRAMPLMHADLGIAGVADVVEFHREGSIERAFPVEYKRGRPKAHQADEVQLCAQAMCLESMLGQSIENGALFYGQTRHRKDVTFDEPLRLLTRQVIRDTRAMLRANETPLAEYVPRRCKPCSLMDLCQPRWLSRSGSVHEWLISQLED